MIELIKFKSRVGTTIRLITDDVDPHKRFSYQIEVAVGDKWHILFDTNISRRRSRTCVEKTVRKKYMCMVAAIRDGVQFKSRYE